MSGAAPRQRGGHRIIAALLLLSDATAAILLAADLLVVCGSVLLRFLFNAPVEWADDVARGLMVGSSFFGAASALARSENLGVAFFVDMLPAGIRRVVDAVGALLVTVIAGYVAFNAIKLGWLTTGQTSGSGPAAGTDVLSDGRRRAVHDDFRGRSSFARVPSAT